MKYCLLCDKPASYKNGLCGPHYRKARYISHPRPIILCSICGKLQEAKGLCKHHYWQTPEVKAKDKARRKPHPRLRKKCLLCGKPAHGKGLCEFHYGQIHRQTESWKEVSRQSSRKRRANKKQMDCWTPEDTKLWNLQLELSEGYCMYCGIYVGKNKLTQDHIIHLNPGPHIGWNTLPCCKPCNSRKHNSLDWKSETEIYFGFEE